MMDYETHRNLITTLVNGAIQLSNATGNPALLKVTLGDGLVVVAGFDFAEEDEDESEEEDE